MASLRANVYIDGFNLYYRALKQNRCNWLNLSKLAALLLPAYDIRRIKYYTAKIQPNPYDPDPSDEVPERQAWPVRHDRATHSRRRTPGLVVPGRAHR